MPGNIAFCSGLAVALVIGIPYFRDPGDVSQAPVRVKYSNMMRFIRNENRLLAIGLSGVVAATIVHFGFNAVSRGNRAARCSWI